MRRQSPILLVLIASGACVVPADPGAPGSPPPQTADDAISLARGHLQSMAGLAHIDPETLSAPRVVFDDLAMAHVQFAHEVDGVPVLGSRVTVHMHDDGRLARLGQHMIDATGVDTTPRYTEAEAIDLALAALGEQADWLTQEPEAELVLLPLTGEAPRLSWAVTARRLDGSEHTDIWRIDIDARDGTVVQHQSRLQTLTGTGTSHHYGSVPLQIEAFEGAYVLEDAVHGVSTYSYGSSSSGLSYIADADTSFDASGQRSGVEAHFGATAFLDYLVEVHGRKGIDDAWGPGSYGSVTGSGRTLAVQVDYGRGYANAFWDGSTVTLGNGDGWSLGPLTSVDIVAHELSHGLIERTANLQYQGESGALNESFADILGAMAERHALGETAGLWAMGEDITLRGGAMRSMSDPTSDGSSRDHYASRYTGWEDNGGVHINSGIANLAFHLAAEGGRHPSRGTRSVQGMGIDAAEAIWFRALTVYLGPWSDFADARNATLQAARDLHGRESVAYAATMDAWAAVGVGGWSSSASSTTAPASDASTRCDAGAQSHTASLDGRGATSVQPDGSYFEADAGVLTLDLYGPASADFDLKLYGWNGRSWTQVAKAASESSRESLQVRLEAGYYTIGVESYDGAGRFELCMSIP